MQRFKEHGFDLTITETVDPISTNINGSLFKDDYYIHVSQFSHLFLFSVYCRKKDVGHGSGTFDQVLEKIKSIIK